MARTEMLPPYSGSCVQIPVSVARTVGMLISMPGRLMAKHRARITMVDNHADHLRVPSCFIALLPLDVSGTYVNLLFSPTNLYYHETVGRYISSIPRSTKSLSAYLKCEIGRIATGLDEFEEPGITCNVKNLGEGGITVPIIPGSLRDKTSRT
jgi:hypothetical protein